MQHFTYSSDAPISDSAQDAFNRFPFAHRVSKIIANRKDINSLVIGIYGAWGEGKTSVFNFIESELSKEEDVVCIRFNPWRFGDENTMLLNFFNDLVRAVDREIETKGEKIGEVVDKYIRPFAQLLGKGENVEAISNVLNSADINEIKIRVEKILKEEGKRIVVLIDDIDRLEKSEIHAVFRMVKLTADFKYTAYILAFDKEMVSASIQERYGSGNSEAGKLFLEKIIQVPLQLLAIEDTDLRDFCYKAIDNALESGEIQLTNEEARLFALNFQGFEALLKTPRQAMLYSNIIMFSLPILKDEVNVVDLMLIEAIRVFIPELYEVIKMNKNVFLKQMDNYSLNQEKERRKLLIEHTLKSYDEVSIKDIEKTITYLFPRLNQVFSNTSYSAGWEKTWEEKQRICSEIYFQRYFSYSIPKGDLSDIKLNNLLQNMEIQSLEENGANIIELINEKNIGMFISKLRNKVQSIDNHRILENLALSIAVLGDYYPHPPQLFSFRNPFPQAAMLINDIILRIEVKRARLNLVNSVLIKAKPLKFAIECFRWLEREEEDSNKNSFNENEIKSIGRNLAKRISLEVKDDFKLLFSDVRNLLTVWNEYGEKNETQNMIKSILDESPKYVINLLQQYLPRGWGSDGLEVKTDLRRETYDAITSDIDVEDIISAINKIYRNRMSDEQYPKFLECSYEELIVRQFLWLHNKAND